MKIEQKLFRKFFYENSSFIEGETVFAELIDLKVAKNLGLEEGEVACLVNKNPFEKYKDAQDVMFFNLDLEMLKAPRIDQSGFELAFIQQNKERGDN
jgi:hypothetical protein